MDADRRRARLGSGCAPAESTYTAPRSSATSVAESTRAVLEASSLRCTPLVSVMASVPADVVTVEPDITAPPAAKAWRGRPRGLVDVRHQYRCRLTGAGVRIGPQIANAMTTEAAAASSTATVSQRRRVFAWRATYSSRHAPWTAVRTRASRASSSGAIAPANRSSGRPIARDGPPRRRRLGVVRLDEAFLCRHGRAPASV